jgi:L-seryl-tRNA(Ser) seleniumtransferase
MEKLLQEKDIYDWFPVLSRPLTVETVRGVLQQARDRALRGETVPEVNDLIRLIGEDCRRKQQQRLMRVINATGISLHTNLGRSPLPEPTWDSTRAVNCGYCNLEYEVHSGKRGKRNGLIPELLSLLVGSETALIVNNNAAAVFLILSTFASGKEVIVSRGEQVQIGGGFRIPDILRLSGATLKEIGTTNITTIDDYKQALSENTGIILQVHRSNFAVHGFTAQPSVKDLAAVVPAGAVLVVDQGSGVTTEQLSGEIRVRDHLQAGAHVVCFSADKILGGPQAGCIVGARGLIKRLQEHPLMRTFRPGKTIYSLLEEYLIYRLNGGQGKAEQDLCRSMEEMKKTARRIMYKLDRRYVSLRESSMSPGGGSSPDAVAPAPAVVIDVPPDAETVHKKLRELSTPIIGTIEHDRVLLNVATIDPRDGTYIRSCLDRIIRECT